MAKYAIIKNGSVWNIAVADAPLAENWIESETARRGDDYDAQSGTFTTPTAPAAVREVSLYQLKVALDAAGLLENADSYVATLPKRAQLFWQYGLTVEPTRSMAQNLAGGLGLTNQEMRAIFVSAMAVDD